MTQEPAELRETLANTGSVSIRDTITIKEQHVKYNVIADTHLNDYKSRILQTKELPDESDFRVYIDCSETVEKWDENGYQDVGEWEHEEGRNGHHNWRTPEGNYVRLSTNRYLSFTTSNTAKMFIDDLLGSSSADRKVEICMAIFLNSVSPREFDYLYAKYESMYESLTQVYGIGDEVATELLEEKDCETYQDAERVLWRTDLPEMYVGDAKSELKEHIEDGKEELVSPSVQKEYSEIIVSSNI